MAVKGRTLSACLFVKDIKNTTEYQVVNSLISADNSWVYVKSNMSFNVKLLGFFLLQKRETICIADVFLERWSNHTDNLQKPGKRD